VTELSCKPDQCISEYRGKSYKLLIRANIKISSKVNSAFFMKSLNLKNFSLYSSHYIILGGSPVDLLCQNVLGAHSLHDHKQQALCV